MNFLIHSLLKSFTITMLSAQKKERVSAFINIWIFSIVKTVQKKISPFSKITFKSKLSFFSYNLNTGQINWKQEVSSIGAPIVDGKNIFILTKNGYFVIIDKDTGKIISSANILKILKKQKQSTRITGFIMGSGKIYSVTSNGYLIVSSPVSGKVEYFKKIGDPVTSTPIINNGKLYILTKNSRIYGFD